MVFIGTLCLGKIICYYIVRLCFIHPEVVLLVDLKFRSSMSLIIQIIPMLDHNSALLIILNIFIRCDLAFAPGGWPHKAFFTPFDWKNRGYHRSIIGKQIFDAISFVLQGLTRILYHWDALIIYIIYIIEWHWVSFINILLSMIYMF